tara:strand:+ start:1034 stop:2230 length:1197 start_codon:yes stop_codon:yes gene_type:complete
MSVREPILFIEINNTEFKFIIGNFNENANLKLVHTIEIPLQGINNKKISDLKLVSSIIKDNVYLIEQKLNFVFKEVIFVTDCFESFAISFTGFKKLNGSQLSKDNITYILNLLKSKISEIENQKKIIHIFNSKYVLDKKEIENLPIGLFGNLYSQETSFILIDNNNYKNLSNVFKNCNLRIKRIISKKFLDGVNIINKNLDLETFLKIQINENDAELIYFENSALKLIQNFKFGSNIILNDISKVTGLNNDTVKKILLSLKFSDKNLDSEILEKEFFENQNFRKIRKKLILDVAKARIEELSEVLIFKNINVISFLKNNIPIFLKINDQSNLKCFYEFYKKNFSKKDQFIVKFTRDLSLSEIYNSAIRIVHYGWKKEALPIVQEKKSIISRLFDKIFN